MRSWTPSTRGAWTSRRRLWLAIAALGLHGAAIWLMWRGSLSVDRQPEDMRVAWLHLHAAAPPARTAPPALARRRPRIAAATGAAPSPLAAPESPPGEPSPAPDAPAIAAGPSTPPSAPRLDLRLPPRVTEDRLPLTPAQDAMRDPRSNTLRLTPAERLLADLGGAECIAWQRMPDGRIFRGPGHSRAVPGMPARPDGSRVQECVL
jgi:hypothetical protein